jgi:hypothetical protein
MAGDELRERQRRRARVAAFVLMLVALGFYVGFIVMSVHRSHG